MKISLIIPVYNEAEALRACLESVRAQSRLPDEVIVVDNNSTDATASIAESYDFVTVINEPRQGVIHARTTGFNYASSNILARIDGDTILPANWTADMLAFFRNNSADAVSGAAIYYSVAASQIFNYIDIVCRRWLSKKMPDSLYLWGANMAIRRSAWLRARSSLCSNGGIHEDYDLGIHLQQIGGQVVFNEFIEAQVSSRRIDTNFISFMKYVMVSPKTYAVHQIRSRLYFYPVVLLCAIGYWPAIILYKGYDPIRESFSLGRVFSRGALKRVDPTSNVA